MKGTIRRLHYAWLPAFLLFAGSNFAQVIPAFRNESLPRTERIQDLLSKLTVAEKVSLLIASSPGIPRLNIDKYYHGNEALHGVVRPVSFIVFPQANALTIANWNPTKGLESMGFPAKIGGAVF